MTTDNAVKYGLSATRELTVAPSREKIIGPVRSAPVRLRRRVRTVGAESKLSGVASSVHSAMIGPRLLPPNQLSRFYAGGDRIGRLRGNSASGSDGPEEWIASTTTSYGEEREGLSALHGGELLRDAIGSDPLAYLGPDHVARWGADPALLVKLLDSGERLPVHFHPGRSFAREHLGLGFGKTEAWIIVSAEAGATVHLGLHADVPAQTMAAWIEDQDVASMLSAMHEIAVRPGDVLFVPAGTPHSIGAGILLVELQEPTDLSVLLEWRRFNVTSEIATLGLGWRGTLAALNLNATPLHQVVEPEPARGLGGSVERLLPEVVGAYFRAQRIQVDGESGRLAPSFAILIVLEGRAMVRSDGVSEGLELTRGATALIPYDAGETRLEGHAVAIRCLPPAPDAGAGEW